MLRRSHMPGYEIARRTGLSPASVSRILRRARLSRWRDLNPPPPVQRYEHPAPGDLAASGYQGHDPLLRGQPARRWAAARQEQASRLSRPACGRRRSLAHGLYSDAARSEGRDHHRLPALGGGLLRPPRHRGARPAHRQRLQLPLQQVPPSPASRCSIKHRRTRPYTPRTNGKAERFIQTALREWAYAKHWTESEQRDQHLQPWTDYYNHQRPHGSLNYKPPISRSEIGYNLLIIYSHPAFRSSPAPMRCTSLSAVVCHDAHDFPCR